MVKSKFVNHNYPNFLNLKQGINGGYCSIIIGTYTYFWGIFDF